MSKKLKSVFANTHEAISTSIHESSHTIYALLYYMNVSEVFIIKSPDVKDRIDGITNYHSLLEQEYTDQELINNIIKSEICLYYAGLLGEQIFFQNISGKLPKFIKNGVGDDMSCAAKLIKKVSSPGKQRYNLKKRLLKQTQENLQNYWDDVVLLSHALFDRKKLNFLDLREILTKKSENKEFWKEQLKTISYIYDNLNTLDEKKLKIILSF